MRFPFDEISQFSREINYCIWDDEEKKNDSGITSLKEKFIGEKKVDE